MRDIVNSHTGVALYLVRVPTRILMIFLGAINASIYEALYAMLLSLFLVAWIKNAPVNLLFARQPQRHDENWIKRLNIPLIRQAMVHLSAITLMTICFYTAGKSLF